MADHFSTQYDDTTINAARDEWDAARAELNSALDAAYAYKESNGYERIPGLIVNRDNDPKGNAIDSFIAKMWEPQTNPLRIGRRSRRYTNEFWPVGKAQKEAAKLRNLAKKLNKLVNS